MRPLYIHGVAISPEPVDLARAALKRLGLVGCGRERDRRPTQSELDRLYAHFDANPRQIIPLSRIVRFAIATAMRQDEICRIAWKDVDEEHRTVLVRNRKDPRDEAGNDQKLPLLDATGLDAWALLAEQRRFSRGPGRVFPHKGRSVGTAFRRACWELKIDDLHFHDLLPGASSTRGLAAWGCGGFRPTGRSGTRAGRVEGPAPA